MHLKDFPACNWLVIAQKWNFWFAFRKQTNKRADLQLNVNIRCASLFWGLLLWLLDILATNLPLHFAMNALLAVWHSQKFYIYIYCDHYLSKRIGVFIVIHCQGPSQSTWSGCIKNIASCIFIYYTLLYSIILYMQYTTQYSPLTSLVALIAFQSRI